MKFSKKTTVKVCFSKTKIKDLLRRSIFSNLVDTGAIPEAVPVDLPVKFAIIDGHFDHALIEYDVEE